MEKIWQDLYAAAKAVQTFKQINEYMSVGNVTAAIESKSGKIYTGICVDTACTLGVCAERNALFNMLTNGEYEFKRVLALLPNGKTGAPCGACREFMSQLMKDKTDQVEIMLDYDNNKIITLKDLTPEWWI